MPKYINDEYQNFMTNMECRITNQNQRMNIVTHRHFESTNISKYGTRINKLMQQMHKHQSDNPYKQN